MAMSSISLRPPLPLLSVSKPNSSLLNLSSRNLPPLSTLSTGLWLTRDVYLERNQRGKALIWRTSVAPEQVLPSDTTSLEGSQQIVSPADDGVGNIISVLLFIAFIILSVLTVGVIYIGVTDFLQKREREKFEKEEATKKKKGGKKGKVKARAGPRGFGQKIDEEVDD